jgi:predicted RND superfamily exporter protein
MLVVSGASIWFIPDFDVEASGDELIMQDNRELQYFREVNQRYERHPFILITYQPDTDLLSPSSLSTLRSLRNDLREMDGVASVISILDVPLLKNPPGPLESLERRIKTVSAEDVNLDQARQELTNSPLYSNSLVSDDFSTTAIQVILQQNQTFQKLESRRFELQTMQRSGGDWDREKQRELQHVNNRYEKFKEKLSHTHDEQIERIREVVQAHTERNNIQLGGIPVIVEHVISYIKNDLWTFGLGILLVVAAMLAAMLRRLRWIVFPLLTCVLSGLVMIGLLGWLDWNVTVVSSNFLSLQLIFTMALVIHIVIRYFERLDQDPDAEHGTLICNASSAAFVPCFYAILTTSAGFSSLLISDLKPVVSFGWIMILGVLVSLLVTFLFLPSSLSLLSRPSHEVEPYKAAHVTAFLGRVTDRFTGVILVLGVGVFAVTLFGITQLSVESSFVNYFRSSTDVYKSLSLIDRKLGGTTPLEIIVNFDGESPAEPQSQGTPSTDDDSFAGFENYAEENTTSSDRETYWYTVPKFEKIERVHDQLDQYRATGKVRSLATVWKVGRDLNGGPLDTLEVQLLMQEVPSELKDQFLNQFVSVEQNQTRITTRIKDTTPSLNRNQLLNRVRRNLVNKNILQRDQFQLTGLFVLYNDMLQSLFKSQIETIGVTVLLIAVILYLLFRSALVTLVALIPNVIATTTILGVMGLGGIPLDLMTITIVAISIGIALDDTIHYLHRFKHEYHKTGNYREAMHRCHDTIGTALAYTTIIIASGFGILMLSNFIPTIRFGLLTAMSMIVALLAALTLLPALVLYVRPFPEPDESGPQKMGSAQSGE